MITIHRLEEGLPLFKALCSDLRVRIYELISSQQGISVSQLSHTLDIPPSTLAPHIKILQQCNLISVHDIPNTSGSGTQRHCFPASGAEQIDIFLEPSASVTHAVSQAEIPVGRYSTFDIAPTCGLASSVSFLGRLDEPRYFAHPSHDQAEILWFGHGYIEYILPNFIPHQNVIDSLELSLELGSEAPQFNNDWPSDITFSLNGTTLCTWTCPGDFGDRRGKQNPHWWYDFMNQYGLLTKLTVNHQGVFLNDIQVSSVTVDHLSLNDQSILYFRIEVPAGQPCGGCTIYGKHFGDHSQGILLKIEHHLQPSHKA